MSDQTLDTIRDLIQDDVGNRGLRTDPAANLITTCAGDFRAACRSLAGAPNPAVAVVTGFFIPHAQPPCGETDGPLGALFLARALVPLGIPVLLATDAFCVQALEAGLASCGLNQAVRVVTLPAPAECAEMTAQVYWRTFLDRATPFPYFLTHLIALERVGPSHTPASLRAQPGSTSAVVEQFEREVPAEHHDRCHTMRGRDITEHMSPAHLLFEVASRQTPGVRTIGIGDGGNEIGMGKVPWDVVRRNIPNGGTVACRVATDQLIVCGVSNWGAYGLAAGVYLLRGRVPSLALRACVSVPSLALRACAAAPDPELFDPEREQDLLRVMVERGPLVDGVSGKPTATVDALDFERYAEPLRRLGNVLQGV